MPGESPLEVDHRFLNGPLIDQVFADETGGNGVLWYLSDTQNTVRDVAKYGSTTAGTQATVRNHLEYNTFGIVTSADDPTSVTANDGDRPGLQGTGNEFSPQRSYTGREPDTATGLIYYRARWYDPRIGRFISEDPIGFAAGDANLSRYVGNSTPNAVDPSGLREPASWRGQWTSGDISGGEFTFKDIPENGPMAGKSAHFAEGNIARGAFPPEAYPTGNALTSSVELDDIGDSYRDRAIAKWVAEGKAPAGVDLSQYDAHHAGPPGSKTIEIVKKDYHSKVAHDGPAKQDGFRTRPKKSAPPDSTPGQNSGAKPQGRGTKAVVRGLVILDVVSATMTACEFAGFPRRGDALTEDAVFTDESGDQFIVSTSLWRWLWLGNEIKYISGPLMGMHSTISEEEMRSLEKVRDDTYGALDWNDSIDQWVFTPGARSQQSLPIYQKLQPWEPGYSAYLPGGSGKVIGYVDSTGEHYGLGSGASLYSGGGA